MSLASSRFGFWISTSILPSDYIELQYVNTNGDTTSGDAKKVNSAAAINTGFIPTANTVLHMTICPGDNENGYWETYIGGSTTGDAVASSWLLRRGANTKTFAFSVNAWTSTGADSDSFTNTSSICEITARIQSIDYVIDGTAKTVAVPNSSSFSGNAPLWIGAAGRSSYGDSYRGCKALIGRTTIYDNEVVVRDYVPAMRKTDQVCGFYELVSKQFCQSIVPNHVFTADSYSQVEGLALYMSQECDCKEAA